MAHREEQEQGPEHPERSDRFTERKGIEVIQPERPPTVQRLPEPPPRPRRRESE